MMKSVLDGVKPEYATKTHEVWKRIAKYFKPDEFQNPYEMDANFLYVLYSIRLLTGKVPLRIISDARPPEQDIGATKSAHKKRPCRAVDLKVKNAYERAVIVLAAVRCGIVRIGIYPGGNDDSGGLHLDAETAADNPSPRIWTKY